MDGKDIRGVLCALAAVAALAGCGGDESAPRPGAGGAAADKAVVDELDPSYLEEQEAIVLDRYGAAPRLESTAAFRLATERFARESGGVRVDVEGLPGATGFRVEHDVVAERLAAWNEEYRRRGAFVLLVEDTFGYGGRDGVLLLPTTDDLVAVDAAGTDGINYEITHREVMAWLRELMRTHPFIVTGAGIDFVEGRFRRPPRDARALARRMYRFCPDVVDQGTGTVAALADELERGTLYLWWD